MNRRIARSVVSIRHTSGLPPSGGSTAATIENLCWSNEIHRRTSPGCRQGVTSGMAGPPRSYAALALLGPQQPRIVQPAKDATHEDQPHASILTSGRFCSDGGRRRDPGDGSYPTVLLPRRPSHLTRSAPASPHFCLRSSTAARIGTRDPTAPWARQVPGTGDGLSGPVAAGSTG
jgi:hypothetical protein